MTDYDNLADELEAKYQRKDYKKKKPMRVSGKSVLKIKKIIEKKATERQH